MKKNGEGFREELIIYALREAQGNRKIAEGVPISVGDGGASASDSVSSQRP